MNGLVRAKPIEELMTEFWANEPDDAQVLYYWGDPDDSCDDTTGSTPYIRKRVEEAAQNWHDFKEAHEVDDIVPFDRYEAAMARGRKKLKADDVQIY